LSTLSGKGPRNGGRKSLSPKKCYREEIQADQMCRRCTYTARGKTHGSQPFSAP